MGINSRPVIAITGSAGKSTTKEMIAAILSRKWRIFKSPGNLNFYTHTMKYAKQVRSGHYRAVVLEYGMSFTGHIRKHCSILRPDISVVTNIGTAHLGNFGGDVKKLIRAKSELIRFMNPRGLAVYNLDDANSRQMPKGKFAGKLVTVGIERKADYRAQNVRFGNGGMHFAVAMDGKLEPLFIPIYGRHQVYNALSAIAVARKLGFGAEDIRRGLRSFKRMQSRLIVHRPNEKLTVIDDSFSANPNAVKAAIDVLHYLGQRRQAKTIAVLGTMLALGAYATRGHQDVGRYVAKRKIDVLYTYGNFTKWIGTAAVTAGFPSDNWHHFATRKALHEALAKKVNQSAVVLIKGSHGAHMGETVQFILRHSRGVGQKKQPHRA